MAPIDIVLTDAGLDALVDAQNGQTEAIRVASVGLTAQAFDPAPTLTALPGEAKRLNTVSGEPVNATTIHLTATDDTTDVYELRGFALYLADGTLFGSWGQADPIFVKASIASFILIADIAFSSNIATSITFGDARFVNPPASETVKGVARIATQPEASAGADDTRIVTPLKLKRVLDALAALLRGEADAAGAALLRDLGALANRLDLDLGALARALTALGQRLDGNIGGLAGLLGSLTGRTITGDGLASGGGDLSQSRVLTVLAASTAEMLAGAATDRALTPASLGGLTKQLGETGVVQFANGLILMCVRGGSDAAGSESAKSITFPLAFPNACLSVMVTTNLPSASSTADVWYQTVGQPSSTGCTVQRQRPSGTTDPISTAPIVWALGH